MKPASYLIEYARAQVGRPYWGGTYGAKASAELLAYKRKQYPALYSAAAVPRFESQFGQKVHDCNGLINGAHVCNTVNSVPKGYPSDYKSVLGLYRSSSHKGALTSETALIDGMLLFRGSFGHVGVYSSGEVIHAKGHRWGVIKEAFNMSEWDHWALADYFYEYNEHAQIRVGDKVRLKQDATVYHKDKRFSDWVYGADLYVRSIRGDRVVVSVFQTGDVTGAVAADDLIRI